VECKIQKYTLVSGSLPTFPINKTLFKKPLSCPFSDDKGINEWKEEEILRGVKFKNLNRLKTKKIRTKDFEAV
jgi:hypothetical protein